MKIDFIKVPMYYGSDRPGVELGPDKIIEEGIEEIFHKNGLETNLKEDVLVEKVSEEDKYKDHKSLKFLNPVKNAVEDLANKVHSSLADGNMPFVIGGDHALAIGSLAGVSGANGSDFAVIWVDAHADINDIESSPSGNIHGMPIAASFSLGYDDLINVHFKGDKIKPENIYILGARSVDDGEYDIIEEYGVNVWYMDDVHAKGVERCLDEIIKDINSKEIDKIHLSYDIDSMDISLVPGTGTPVEDGFDHEQSETIIRKLLQTELVRSIDFVEFNPVKDIEDITLNSVLKMLNIFAEELGKLN